MDRFRIGMLIFDNMTNLDFAGPADIFARVPHVETIVIAKTADAVRTDSGGRVLPDMVLRTAPELDLLFVGGGPGTLALMEDAEVLTFLKQREPRSQWVTSVCTGALVLGAAGLLRGYKAATHWNAMAVLPIFGAEAVHERVVIDRNRVTGGGVTAGIDFALTVVGKLWSDDTAKTIQLGCEYNPAPPYDAGSPDSAPAHLVEQFRQRSVGLLNKRVDAAHRAMALL